MNHLIPKYYNEFKCIGSDCPETCCQGWKISIDKDTFNKYQKLDNVNLKNKSDKFVKKLPKEVKGFYAQINMNNGTCPFLGQDKFVGVRIQAVGNTHYAWIRMSMSEDGTNVIVKEYAYHITPNAAITAGAK